MQSTAATVDEYMETVPPERKEALDRLRDMCRNILTGYEERMEYGMPAYAKGSGGIAFNSQKNYIALYVEKDVLDKYRNQLKDVGKSCIRYRKPEQIDFELVEKLLRDTTTSSGEFCP